MTIVAAALALATVAFMGKAASVPRSHTDGAAPFAAPSHLHAGAPASYARARAATADARAETARAALAQSLGGVDGSLVRGISLSAPAASSGYDHGQWLHATIAGRPSTPHQKLMRAIWEASLAQGAVADRLAGTTPNLADVIVDSTISVRGPDGRLVEVAGGAGDVVSQQLFGAQQQRLSDAAISHRVRAELTSFGLAATGIRVLHPLGPAVSVRATITHLRALKGRFASLVNALNPSQAEFEGLYVELDSARGAPVVLASQSLRVGNGQVWFASGMDRYLGIIHG